jgi:anaerobic selenocysteine-containing dehydrogenase
VKDGKVVKVEGDENHPWNQGRGCQGFCHDPVYVYKDRILYLYGVGPREIGALRGSAGMRLMTY